MSLELIESEIKKKFEGGTGSGLGGKSIHEHASAQLLYPYVWVDNGKKDANGEPVLEKEIDVDSRTELPSPSGTVVLESYANYLDKTFGRGRGRGMRYVNVRYKVDMTSKDRKGRAEFTQIAVGASLNQDDSAKSVVQAVTKQ